MILAKTPAHEGAGVADFSFAVLTKSNGYSTYSSLA
jgi:hypothetical protein